MTDKPTTIGQRRLWPPQTMWVTAVAECPGWVFVMPPPNRPGRPFSIAYAAWCELETAELQRLIPVQSA